MTESINCGACVCHPDRPGCVVRDGALTEGGDMAEGHCTGLHPYGPCSPGEGCNASPDGAYRELLAAVRDLLAEVADGNIHGTTIVRLRGLAG